ncbi:DUF2254 domain-containing protein [Streptosporangium sp. OZ121]|uniref:DUF2254 domain-containing protein n=1 Tax=Streptosporangium sp. OZ121 TaxID=3444183 RepID=UPI003F7A03FB
MIGQKTPLRRGVSGDIWRTRLWPLPAAGVIVAGSLGVGLPLVDAHLIGELPGQVTVFLFSGGPEAARTVLSVIASSLITVTALTFSLTVVTLQLASSQYSPRLLRTFAQDRFVHITLALLLSTFTYAVTVLRTVRASLDDQSAFVPQLSVTVAYLLALASVIGLVVFLAHLARQIRVESLLRSVHAEAEATMHRCTDAGGRPVADVPATPATPATGTTLLRSGSSGFLTSVDEAALLRAAVDADAVVVVDRLPGDWLTAGTPVAVAWALRSGTAVLDRETTTVLSERVAQAVQTGFERTAAQDIAFGLRQITDVVVKALSPGINDPTTAVHALGHASALLCEVADRDLGPILLRDDSGTVRVVVRRPDFPALLDLALTQPRRYGATDPDVLERLFTLLREVAWTTRRAEHRVAVREQLRRLRATAGLQDHDRVEGRRVEILAWSVQEALAGRWPTGDPVRPLTT